MSVSENAVAPRPTPRPTPTPTLRPTPTPTPTPKRKLGGKRFSPEEEALLTALSGPYELDGKIVSDPPNRAGVVAASAESKEPLVRQITPPAAEMLVLADSMALLPAKRAEALTDFGEKWRSLMGDAVLNPDLPYGEFVEKYEKVVEKEQTEQAQELYLQSIGTDLSTVIRRRIAVLADHKDAWPEDGKMMFTATPRLYKLGGRMMIVVQVENPQGSRVTYHQCLFASRRTLDQACVLGHMEPGAAAAHLLGMAAQFKQVNSMNDLIVQLHIYNAAAENGSCVYVPEFAPGQVLIFPIAPAYMSNCTNHMDISGWCDEGTSRDAPVDMTWFMAHVPGSRNDRH